MLRSRVLITNFITTSGGGTRTALSIARCLADAGYLTDLVSLWGLDLKALEKLHGIKLSDLTSKGLLRIYYRPRRDVFASARYFSYRSFKDLVRDFIKTGSYNAFFFFDDVLRIKELINSDETIFLYTHFSFIHRIMASLFEDLIKEVQHSKLEIFKERLMRALLSNFFMNNLKAIKRLIVLANSTVTLSFIKSLWKLDPILLHPPITYPSTLIESSRLFGQKEDIVVSVGVFEPTKKFGVIIEAFAKSRMCKKAKLIMIGSPANTAYLTYLREKALRLGIADKVKFLLNLSDEEKWNTLYKSKIIVHAKIFEPFGIAVAEGMYAGCIPIVFKGSLSGPWIDLTERGRYGFGFKDVDELADLIDYTLTDYDKMKDKVNAIIVKASMYSYEKFRKQLIDIVTKQLV